MSDNGKEERRITKAKKMENTTRWKTLSYERQRRKSQKN